MKLSAVPWLLVGALSVAPPLAAQPAGDKPLSEAALYSLYVKRHDATVEFANLAVARAADAEVKKAAENLVKTHREVREKLEKVAKDRQLTLAPPKQDVSTELLDKARASLEGKSGASFDAAWANLAQNWLSTLILDNNRTVKPRIGPELQPMAQEHTSFLFRQSAELGRLAKKFK